MTERGTLLVCAGPIGNLGDAPPRLGEALASADVVYVEDTRRARVLLDRLGVRRPLVSYFAGNEERRVGEIARRLTAGETVAILTDAGTPGISDPGLSAVRAAVEVGARVSGVPGPSAVTFALAVAGLPSDRFVFEGFLPRRGSARSERIGAVANEGRTVVLFCSPSRLSSDLAALAEASAGRRPCVVVREMTKVHEEVWRGDLAGAAAHWSATDVRGEVTVVIGAGPIDTPSLDDAVAEVDALVGSGMARSEAVRRVAAERGVSRRLLYEATLGDEDG